MKYLLQELKDYKMYKTCLSGDLQNCYQEYLIKSLKKHLKEFTCEQLYQVYTREHLKDTKDVENRIKNLKGQFIHTKHYDLQKDKNTGKLTKVPTSRTHLQNSKKEFCTKQEFVDDFLSETFTDQNKAKELLNAVMELFDDEGWLII